MWEPLISRPESGCCPGTLLKVGVGGRALGTLCLLAQYFCLPRASKISAVAPYPPHDFKDLICRTYYPVYHKWNHEKGAGEYLVDRNLNCPSRLTQARDSVATPTISRSASVYPSMTKPFSKWPLREQA